jgi:hypothetical protein
MISLARQQHFTQKVNKGIYRLVVFYSARKSDQQESEVSAFHWHGLFWLWLKETGVFALTFTNVSVKLYS